MCVHVQLLAYISKYVVLSDMIFKDNLFFQKPTIVSVICYKSIQISKIPACINYSEDFCLSTRQIEFPYKQ